MKLKRLSELHKAYREGKEKAFDESVNAFETGPPLYFLAFLAFLILIWGTAYAMPFGLEEVYDRFGFIFVALPFAGAYFSLYSGSKFIFRPTPEEIEDDTSTFAIFSACGRKERRGLISIVFAIVHTMAFVAYLVHKDTGWLNLP